MVLDSVKTHTSTWFLDREIHQLVSMIYGHFTPLKFPYIQFAATSTKSATLFLLFWQVVFRLT